MTKRLLFLIHSLSMGGAERVAANLANHWAGKGYTVAVATLSSDVSDFYALDPRIERIALNMAKQSQHALAGMFNNLRNLKAVRRLLRKWQPQVSIALMSTSNVYLALCSWGLPGKKIGSERIHPPMLPLGRVWGMLRRLAYGRLDHLVALTEPSAAWLRTNTQAKHITVIGNSIPWPLPAQAPVFDPIAVLQPSRRHILAAGRLAEQKGFDLLIAAFARLAPSLADWALVIVGEGPLRASLAAQVVQLGLQDRVDLVGMVGNVGDWYSACDVYVMSSRFEGFPNTLVEAMAHGLPVISFDCDTGPRDIIRNDVDGWLVPVGDVDALEVALKAMMTDERLRKRLAQRAIETRERLSLERIAAQWEALFEEFNNGK